MNKKALLFVVGLGLVIALVGCKAKQAEEATYTEAAATTDLGVDTTTAVEASTEPVTVAQ